MQQQGQYLAELPRNFHALRGPYLKWAARFQQAPIDVYRVADVPPSLGGPLIDEKGTVHALYMSFAHEEEREIRQSEWAMPVAVLRESLALYRSGERYRSLDLTLAYRPLADARRLGLPEEWLARYDALEPDARRVLYVSRTAPGGDVAEPLQGGAGADEQLRCTGAERHQQQPGDGGR